MFKMLPKALVITWEVLGKNYSHYAFKIAISTPNIYFYKLCVLFGCWSICLSFAKCYTNLLMSYRSVFFPASYRSTLCYRSLWRTFCWRLASLLLKSAKLWSLLDQLPINMRIVGQNLELVNTKYFSLWKVYKWISKHNLGSSMSWIIKILVSTVCSRYLYDCVGLYQDLNPLI